MKFANATGDRLAEMRYELLRPPQTMTTLRIPTSLPPDARLMLILSVTGGRL